MYQSSFIFVGKMVVSLVAEVNTQKRILLKVNSSLPKKYRKVHLTLECFDI